MNAERVAFFSEGTRIAGHFRAPTSPQGRAAAVVFAAGFSLTKEVWLPAYAEALNARGYATLNFDYRSFGDSEGKPRCRLIPQMQVDDVRNAVTYLQSRSDIARDRIAVVGVSLGAAVALGAAGVDDRVKAMVAVAGPSDLWRTWSALPNFASFHSKVQDARAKLVTTGEVTYVPVVKLLSADAETCAKITADAPQFPTWRPEITFESLASLFEFRPELVAHQSRASCFIYCGADALIGKSEATSAYEKAREPKQLVELAGVKHVEIYGALAGFLPCVDAISAFLGEHL